MEIEIKIKYKNGHKFKGVAEWRGRFISATSLILILNSESATIMIR